MAGPKKQSRGAQRSLRALYTMRIARQSRSGEDLDDLEDEGALEALLQSLGEAPRSSRSGRTIDYDPSGAGGPLAAAWAARTDGGGASAALHRRGLLLLLARQIGPIWVERGQIHAEVGEGDRARVSVDFLPPPFALAAAVMARVGELRATLPQGADLRSAQIRAILGAGPTILPAPAQMSPTCTCSRGPRCDHLYALLHAFGSCIELNPEHLFALWGLADSEPARLQPLVIAPLPPDKPLLTGDLSELFGIELIDPTNAPGAAVGVSASPSAVDEPEPPPAPPEPEPEPEPEPPPPPAPPEPPPEPAPVAAEPDQPRPPSERRQVTREYLRVIGIPTRRINTWIRAGALREAGQPDVFERTAEVSRLITEFLDR